MSNAADRQDGAPHGTALLPSDLTEDQLAVAPVLRSIDTLLIEELSEDEDDAFATALARIGGATCQLMIVPVRNYFSAWTTHSDPRQPRC